MSSGRSIILDRLIQARTYGGMLEGTPNKRLNDESIQWALDDARGLRQSVGQPLLIAPDRRDYKVTPGDMQPVLDGQSNRPPEMRHIPEWLPLVQCIGIFSSISPARDRSKDASSLTILWFQDDFGINPAAIDIIRRINWEQHAADWSY